jgi:hypothetical protein
MYRVINLSVGFISVIPGIIMALGLWNTIGTLPPFDEMIKRPLGSFVIIAVVAMLQSKKDIKKVSQLGIAVGFLWTMTALIMELEL